MQTLADEIIERLRDLAGVQKDVDLAAWLEVSKSTLSSWRSRGSVPIEISLRIADKCGVTLDWLVRGVGNMRFEAAVPPEPAANVGSTLSARDLSSAGTPSPQAGAGAADSTSASGAPAGETMWVPAVLAMGVEWLCEWWPRATDDQREEALRLIFKVVTVDGPLPSWGGPPGAADPGVEGSM